MKRIEFEGRTHEFPDDFTDAEIASVLSGGQAAPAPTDTRSGMGQTASGYLKALHDVVAKGLSAVDSFGMTGTQRALQGSSPGFFTPEGINPVPRNLPEAGVYAAVPVAGRLTSGAGPAMQALSRITGGLIGGEVGGQLEGRPTGSGAAEVAPGLVLGEGIGAGLRGAGSVLRGVSNNPIAGGKRAIADDYQAGIGKTIGEIVPEFGTPKTGEDFAALSRLARGTRLPPGMSQQAGHEELLGGMLDTAQANINQMIGPQRLNITQLPPGTVPTGAAGQGTLLNAQGQPVMGVNTSAPSGMSFESAVGLLRQLYGRGYHGGTGVTNPAIAQLDPAAAKQAATLLKQEIESELQRISPAARNLFQTSQNKFAMGTEIAADIDQALRLSPNRTELTEPALQQTVFNRLGDVSAKLGRQRVTEAPYGDDLMRYLAAVYRQGGLGKTIPATGTGGAGDSFRRAFLQGQGGTPSAMAAIPKALAENAGAVYTGQKPYSFGLPPQLQAILDAVMQKGLGQPQ